MRGTWQSGTLDDLGPCFGSIVVELNSLMSRRVQVGGRCICLDGFFRDFSVIYSMLCITNASGRHPCSIGFTMLRIIDSLPAS